MKRRTQFAHISSTMVALLWVASAAAAVRCTLTEQQVLSSPTGGPFENFGNAVDVSGDWLVVGNHWDFAFFFEAGTAELFHRVGGNWEYFGQKLLSNDPQQNDHFGTDVAIDGNVIVVGAPGDADLGSLSGSAFVFRYDGTDWLLEQQLLASDGDASDGFGAAVAIQGNRIVVGATFYDINPGENAGAAYVFDYDGTQWVQTAILMSPTPAHGDLFGTAVSVDGDRIAVGAIGTNGPNGENWAGASFVYRFDGANWALEADLRPTGPASGNGASFGWDVDLDGDRLAVGAPDYDNPWTGGVFLYTFDGTAWNPEAVLTPSDGIQYDQFGRAVELQADTLLVGAERFYPWDWQHGGKAYIFRNGSAGWAEENMFQGSQVVAGDRFGCAVALDPAGATAVVAARGTNTQRGEDAGVVYTFDLNCGAVTGDIDGDGDVDLTDLAILLSQFDLCAGDPAFDPAADFDNSGCIDLADLAMLLANFGN